MADILVIGYGNELRGDDALGPRVAETVASWRLPRVRALARHQLTPELSELISTARAVIFVDATADVGAKDVQAQPIQASSKSASRTHTSDPRSLLALARAAFGRCPPGWMITVPAENFEIGEGLTPMAERGTQRALRIVRRLCASL